MLRNLLSHTTLVTAGALALAAIAIIAVFAVGLWLIRLATPRSQVADYAQRIQGPQEAPTTQHRRD